MPEGMVDAPVANPAHLEPPTAVAEPPASIAAEPVPAGALPPEPAGAEAHPEPPPAAEVTTPMLEVPAAVETTTPTAAEPPLVVPVAPVAEMPPAAAEAVTPAEPAAPAETPAATPMVPPPGPAQPDAAPSEPDDFLRILNVTPQIVDILSAAGIHTYRELAAADPAHLRQLLEAAGLSGVDPSTWPQQGRFAAGGKWKQLQNLQNRLAAG